MVTSYAPLSVSDTSQEDGYRGPIPLPEKSAVALSKIQIVGSHLLSGHILRLNESLSKLQCPPICCTTTLGTSPSQLIAFYPRREYRKISFHLLIAGCIVLCRLPAALSQSDRAFTSFNSMICIPTMSVMSPFPVMMMNGSDATQPGFVRKSPECVMVISGLSSR